MRSYGYSGLGLSLVVVACSGHDPSSSPLSQTGARAPSTVTSLSPLGAPAAPTVASSTAPSALAYVVTTLANASCSIYPTGQSSPQGGVLADARGVVRFYFPPVTWGTQLSLDCTSPNDGSMASYSADLTSTAILSPPASAATPAPSTVLPALTGDPDSYTQSELVAAGYPPRPGHSVSPTIYAKWLQAVSSATTIIDPQPTARLDQFNDNTAFFYSSPWGSLVLENGPTYVVAFAEFNIPYAYADGLGGLASIWTGLGGWNGNQALIQAGVEFDYGGFFGSSYYAWIEYWTNNQINVSLGVSPGQELYDEVWASDSSGHVNAKGGWGAFYLKNLTTGSAIPIMGIQAPHPFVGATAESVIEAHPPRASHRLHLGFHVLGCTGFGGCRSRPSDRFLLVRRAYFVRPSARILIRLQWG
jgi:hypothetical protein